MGKQQEWWTGDREVHRAGEDDDVDWVYLLFGYLAIAMIAVGAVGVLWVLVAGSIIELARNLGG